MKGNRLIWGVVWTVCLALLMPSCEKGEKKQTLGASKGLPNELLLVVDGALWSTAVKDSLEDVLKGGVPGLSQYEPMFRMMKVAPRDFSAQFSTLRNIVEVRLDPKVGGVEMGVAYNVKARPQTYLSIRGNNAESIGRFLGIERERIRDIFVQSEMKREIGLLKQKHNKAVDEATREIFGYTVKVPADIARLKKAENFLWASTDRLQQDMNFVCYSLPMADSAVWLTNRWVEWRDSTMKRNIPGSTPEQWMATVYEDGKPLTMQRALTLSDGRKVYEMRGLWEMHKGGIGGPFVSLACPDTAGNRMLVTEGFIYSPNANKRDLVRRMEAALRTFMPVR